MFVILIINIHCENGTIFINVLKRLWYRKLNMSPLPLSYKYKFLEFQRNELTEYHIYTNLAKVAKSKYNREILTQLADTERGHAEFWKRYTNTTIQPHHIAV